MKGIFFMFTSVVWRSDWSLSGGQDMEYEQYCSSRYSWRIVLSSVWEL